VPRRSAIAGPWVAPFSLWRCCFPLACTRSAAAGSQRPRRGGTGSARPGNWHGRATTGVVRRAAGSGRADVTAKWVASSAWRSTLPPGDELRVEAARNGRGIAGRGGRGGCVPVSLSAPRTIRNSASRSRTAARCSCRRRTWRGSRAKSPPSSGCKRHWRDADDTDLSSSCRRRATDRTLRSAPILQR
jgi:hypothetical protein